MPSRRTFLAGVTSGALAISGCLDRLSGPEFSVGSGMTTRDPVFTDDPTDWGGKPFRADVFATPDDLIETLNVDVLTEHRYDDYTEFDPEHEFAAIFASKLAVTPSGVSKGWCPRSDVDDDRFVFHVPLDGWPDELEDPAENWVRLNRWRRNGTEPPTRAVTDVRLTDETDADVKTCSE